MAARVRRCLVCKHPTMGDPTAVVINRQAFHRACLADWIERTIDAMSDKELLATMIGADDG